MDFWVKRERGQKQSLRVSAVMSPRQIRTTLGVLLTELYSKPKPLLTENGFVLQSLTPTKLTLKQGLLGFVKMVDNVVELFGKNPTVAVVDEADPVLDFVQELLIPWAIDNGLDIDSMKFKLNGATIMTCLQGMLLDGI
jgi:hypothetical protein